VTQDALDLARLSEAQFDNLYATRIAPLFVEGDKERASAVATFRTRLSIGAPVAVVGAAATGILSKEAGLGVFVGIVGLVLAYTIAYLPLQALGDRMKAAALSAIAAAINVRYAGEGGQPETMARFRMLDLLPSHDRSRFEDFFHGERLGCTFDLCEAVLEDRRRDKDGKTSYVTVFRGQMMRLAFPKKFLATTVVRRDLGIFNALRGMGELKRVGLGDSTFERSFEVYSSDQVEARYLVHPVFMERLLELEKLYKGRNLRCAFEDGDLLVAVETPDQFEIGDMFKPLADPARARRIVDDIAGVMRLMDAVLTAEIAPLVGRQ
jgi:hypothetical protein